MSKKVLVGMSGGVDSSVAAALLKEQGYQVTGATFRLWEPEGADGQPCGESGIRDAEEVCRTLEIEHRVLDYRETFREKVVEPFVRTYLEGRTPNPCVTCNRTIKLGAFLDTALSLGYDFVATGHYARIRENPQTGRYELLRGAYLPKDQSYVLYHLNQRQLRHFLLPVGGRSKDELRALAEQKGLAVADKPDSQDICFIPDGDHAAFLQRYTGARAETGFFIDEEGRPLGRHQGIGRYTLGQRKGLGISLGTPAFVSAIDPAANTVTLVRDESRLLQSHVLIEELNLIPFESLDAPLRAEVRIRYSHRPCGCTVTPLKDSRARIDFDTPQRAPTPGQAAVFYLGETVAGGGTIIKEETP